jgi:hypothetical protein
MEAVKLKDLSVKELAAEDDESSMEEPEVKLGGEEPSEKDESVVDCWVLPQDALLSFLAGIALGLWFGPSAFRLVVTFLGIVWFSSKAVLERREALATRLVFNGSHVSSNRAIPLYPGQHRFGWLVKGLGNVSTFGSTYSSGCNAAYLDRGTRFCSDAGVMVVSGPS